MTARTKYWWRVDLYEPDEMTSDRTHGRPFRRIEFRGPGQAHVGTGKHRKLIEERLAKVGYRVTGTLERASLKPRGEWEWRGGLWLAQQRPGKEISGRVSQMERPFFIGPGPDEPVPKARGVNVIDWPRGRPNPRGEHIVWPIDQIMEIESRLEAGETVEAVANVMGVATSCIIKLADEAGMERRRRPPKGNPYATKGTVTPSGTDEYAYRGYKIAVSHGNMAGEQVWKAKVRDPVNVPIITLAGSTKASRDDVVEWARLYIDQLRHAQGLSDQDQEPFHIMDLEIWGLTRAIEAAGKAVTRPVLARHVEKAGNQIRVRWGEECEESFTGMEPSEFVEDVMIPTGLSTDCYDVWDAVRAHKHFASLPLADRLKWLDTVVKQYRLQRGLPTENPRKPRSGRRRPRSSERRKLLRKLLRL